MLSMKHCHFQHVVWLHFVKRLKKLLALEGKKENKHSSVLLNLEQDVKRLRGHYRFFSLTKSILILSICLHELSLQINEHICQEIPYQPLDAFCPRMAMWIQVSLLYARDTEMNTLGILVTTSFHTQTLLSLLKSFLYISEILSQYFLN